MFLSARIMKTITLRRPRLSHPSDAFHILSMSTALTQNDQHSTNGVSIREAETATPTSGRCSLGTRICTGSAGPTFDRNNVLFRTFIQLGKNASRSARKLPHCRIRSSLLLQLERCSFPRPIDPNRWIRITPHASSTYQISACHARERHRHEFLHQNVHHSISIKGGSMAVGSAVGRKKLIGIRMQSIPMCFLSPNEIDISGSRVPTNSA